MCRSKTFKNREILRRALAAGLLLCVVASGAPIWAEDSPPPPPPAPGEDGPLDRDTDILTLETPQPSSAEPSQLRSGRIEPSALGTERIDRPWWDLRRLLHALMGAAGLQGPGRGTAAGAHRQSP